MKDMWCTIFRTYPSNGRNENESIYRFIHLPQCIHMSNFPKFYHCPFFWIHPWSTFLGIIPHPTSSNYPIVHFWKICLLSHFLVMSNFWASSSVVSPSSNCLASSFGSIHCPTQWLLNFLRSIHCLASHSWTIVQFPLISWNFLNSSIIQLP